MKKLLKLFFILVGVLLAIVIAAMVAAFYYLDPNLYKEEIIELVKEKTGRELKIDGRIEKSFYPQIGIRLNEISLGNPPGFGEEQFFQIKQARLAIKLIPLFKKQVEVEKVALKGLSLHLIKNAQGVGNWKDFETIVDEEVDSNEASSSVADKDSASIASADDSGLVFKFAGFELIGAALRWTDKVTGQDVALTDINIFVPLEDLFSPFPIKLSGHIALNEPSISADFSLQTKMQISSTFEQIKLEKIRMTLAAKGDMLPQNGVNIEANLELLAELASSLLSVPSFEVRAEGVVLQGKAGLTWGEALAWNADIEIPQFSPRELATKFAIPLPPMREPKALTQFAANMRVKGGSNSARVEPLQIEFDQSKLKGFVALPSIDPQQIRFDLTLDQLNLDGYLPPPSADETAKGKQSEAQSEPLDPALLEPLQKLDIQGQFAIGELTFSNLRTTDALIKIKGKDGVISLDPFSAKLYGGTLKSTVQMDARSSNPKMQLGAELDNFMAGPFTAALLGKERVTGEAMVKLALTTQGLDVADLTRSLNGDIGFEFRNGAVSGINIAQIIRNAQARLTGQKPEEDVALDTDFAVLSGTLKAVNGVLNNLDLQAASPLLRVTGKGAVNLVDEVVDYTVITTLVGTIQGQGGRALDELMGIPLPIRAKGPMLDPSFSLDLLAALSDRQKQKLDEKTAAAKEQVDEVKDKVKDRASEKLRGLLGR